ncbi:MAG: PHP domain-containing protein [Clostridia bacterium]|nr:PHP domain-containing protein [Clostridia bacterium]
MNAYRYDLHIHSCLSPCGDDDMTPASIAGVGALVGLQIMALTDHNTCKNCPAFFKAAKRYGIVPVAGMELTTAEDIHVLCLLPSLEAALDFDREIDKRRMKVPLNEKIFGRQLIMDENDNVIGTEPDYLLPATDVPIDDVPALVSRFGGVSYPAHVDRESNGVIAVLGAFPDNPGFLNAEFYDASKKDAYLLSYPALRTRRVLVSSDAHNLWSIRDENDSLTLDDEPYSSDRVREALFRVLKGETR